MEKTLIMLLTFAATFMVAILVLRAVLKPGQAQSQDPNARQRQSSARRPTIRARHNLTERDLGARPTPAPQTTPRFLPSSDHFKPIQPQFTLADLPPLVVPSDGGLYGSEIGKYQTHIGTLSCTCSAGQQRNTHPQGDPRRICHHLMRHLSQRRLITGLDPWAKTIIDNAEAVPLEAWELKLETAPPMLVTQGSSDEWLNLFAHSKRSGERIADASGPIERHGWSLKKQRWSYGSGPPGAMEARKRLIEATS